MRKLDDNKIKNKPTKTSLIFFFKKKIAGTVNKEMQIKLNEKVPIIDKI